LLERWATLPFTSQLSLAATPALMGSVDHVDWAPRLTAGITEEIWFWRGLSCRFSRYTAICQNQGKTRWRDGSWQRCEEGGRIGTSSNGLLPRIFQFLACRVNPLRTLWKISKLSSFSSLHAGHAPSLILYGCENFDFFFSHIPIGWENPHCVLPHIYRSPCFLRHKVQTLTSRL
jgi:hypothetical protein